MLLKYATFVMFPRGDSEMRTAIANCMIVRVDWCLAVIMRTVDRMIVIPSSSISYETAFPRESLQLALYFGEV